MAKTVSSNSTKSFFLFPIFVSFALFLCFSMSSLRKYKRDPAAWVQRQASQSQDVEAPRPCENGNAPIYGDLPSGNLTWLLMYLFKMVKFYSYVSLLEGNQPKWCRNGISMDKLMDLLVMKLGWVNTYVIRMTYLGFSRYYFMITIGNTMRLWKWQG